MVLIIMRETIMFAGICQSGTGKVSPVQMLSEEQNKRELHLQVPGGHKHSRGVLPEPTQARLLQAARIEA